MQQPLVSILMPAYNCAAFIRQAIDSILAQTYTNWELLIADDASTDQTKAITETYLDPRVKHYPNPQNLGYLETWNKLAALAQGDYVTFMDADDYSAVDRVELLLNYMLANPACGAVGSNYVWVSEAGVELKRSDFPLTHQDIVNPIPKQWHIIGSALMIKAEVLQTIGYYNTFFNRLGQEDHYWFYLITEKYQVANIHQHLYYYRYNTQSVSGNLANNPRKLFTGELVEMLIESRKQTGSDFLADGKTDELNKWLDTKAAPYLSNKAHMLHYLAKRRFYEGHKQQALGYAKLAVLAKPLNLQYLKDYIYFYRNRH